MNIDNEGMFLSNVGICVGVAKDGRFKLAHLVVLERPQYVFTFPWQSGEHFETGSWYRQVRVKDEQSAITKTYWKLIEDEFIPTILVRAGERLTLIEVSLPIFFAPDLSLFSSLQLRTSKFGQKPICPLFGQESVQILDLPVDGFTDRNGNLPIPGTLYCVRVQISFTPGLIPIWMYNQNYAGILDSFHWTSAFLSEDSICTDIFKSYRIDGLVIEKVTRKIASNQILHYYLILQENAKDFPPRIAIAVGQNEDKYGDGKSLSVGDWISFLPIMLDCYTFPVLFALQCPSSNTITNKHLKLFKESGGDYKLTLKITDEYLACIQSEENTNNCRLPVLGLLVDPFNCSKDILNKLGHRITIEIRPQWHLEKGVVIWTVLDSCESSRMPVLETKKCFKNTGSVDNFAINDNNDNLNNFSASLTGLNKLSFGSKRILAAYFTYKCSTNCFVFFEFCEITNTFSTRHDIPLQPNSIRNITIGEWFFIDIECISNKSQPIIVKSIVPTSPRVETRIRHNICAQFRGGGYAVVKFWHCSDQYCAGSKFYSDPDKIWWPDLCVKCFPKETTNISPLNEGNTHYRPYSAYALSRNSNCGSSTASNYSTTHSNNKNNINSKSSESLFIKNRKIPIREQERREKLEQRERIDKLQKMLEIREKAKYEELKSSKIAKSQKLGGSRCSIFSNGYRQYEQKKQNNINTTSSRTTLSEKQQNLYQNDYQDIQHNKQQNNNKNKEKENNQNIQQNNQNISQNKFKTKHQNVHQNIQEDFNQNFTQNIQENKQNVQQNKLKNKNQNIQQKEVHHIQQNKQPKPINKCFSVQKTKTFNVDNVDKSTTTSYSTLKNNETNQNNKDDLSSNNSLLNETLEIQMSESSDDEGITEEAQQKQRQPFFVAAEFSSLKVSDDTQTKQVLEEEPGGFGYSRRRRFDFEQKANQEQQKIENPFRTFQICSNNFGKESKKENNKKVQNKGKVEKSESVDFSIDEALNASLSDDEKNEEDDKDNEDVFEYDEEEMSEEEQEEEEEEYADYSGSRTSILKSAQPVCYVFEE